MSSAGIRFGVVAGFALLAACGGSGGGSASLEQTRLTGSAVKGPIVDAGLTVREVNPITGVVDLNASPLESSLTDADGNFSLSANSANKAVFISTDGGTFVDESDPDPEADGRRHISLSSGQGLTIYKPAADSQVSITILTEAMTSRAKQLAASQLISFDNAFSAVRDLMTSAFGFDPLSTVAINPLAPPGDASDAEIQYALTIGGLANAVNEVAIRAGYGQMSAEVIDAFITDLSDGVIDGNNAGTPIMLNGQAMPQVDLDSAIDLFRNNNDSVYQNVIASKPNQNTLAAQPQPSNQQPTVELNSNANLTVVQGQSISLNSSLVSDDPDGDNTNLKLLLVEPVSVGQVLDGQNQPVSAQGTPREQLTYLASDFPPAGETQIQLAVVDEANGAAYITLPVQVNGPPQPEDDNFANGIEDTPIVLNVLVNDQDPNNDPLSIVSVTAGQGGIPSIEDNQISFQPLPNFNGTATFTYSVSDGASSASASVELQIQAVNDDPIAQDETGSTLEDTLIGVFVLSNDSDPDGDSLSITSIAGETNGTAVIDNDRIDFTPAANFNGQASFSYTVSDGQGGTDVGSVSLTVLPVNDDPVATDDTGSTLEDTLIGVFVLANDSDPDGDTLSIQSINGATNGTAVINNGQVDFTPANNFNGQASFSYTVSDGQGGSNVGNVSITVTAVNDDPVAVGDSGSTPEDTLVTIDVLANDTDPENDALIIQAISDETNGTAVINNGQVDFTPTANFNGLASFSYTVSDGNGGSDVGNVSITVTSVNDQPVAADDTATTVEDTLVTVNVLANDSDPDNDTLVIQSISGEINGTAVINLGQVDFTPTANFNGSAGFSYTVSDGNGGSDVGNVSITVSAVNDDPVAVDDSAVAGHNQMVTIDVLANDNDPENDTLTITAVTAETNGTAIINNGQIDFTPATGFSGAASFNYTISDGNGGSANANVSVDVQAPPAFYVASGGSGDCSTPVSPCGDITQALDAAQSVTPSTVNVAAGNYVVNGSTAINLRAGVSLLGGWDSGFSTRDPVANPTVISSNETANGSFTSASPTMRCAAGVGDDVLVDGFSIWGSDAIVSGDPVALKLTNNCAAVFSNNAIDAKGNTAAGNAFTIFIGDSNDPAHPSATFKNNRIVGGQSTSLGIGIFYIRSQGTIFDSNYIEAVNTTGSNDGQAIRTQSGDPATDSMMFTNNVIASSREAVFFNGGANIQMQANTIFANSVAFDGSNDQSNVVLYNNIIMVSANAPAPSTCAKTLKTAGSTGKWEVESNAFVGCVNRIVGLLGTGGTDIDNFSLTAAEVGFADMAIDYFGPEPFTLLESNATAIDVVQDLSLTRNSDCGLLYGAKVELLSSEVDIKGNQRASFYDGYCSYVKEFVGTGDAISMGAFEFELNARYVSQTGQDTGNCSDETVPCATIGYALGQAQAGDEVRVSGGNYLASAGDGLANRALINKPLSLVGGYNATFSDIPSCTEQSCATQIGLIEDATGAFNSAVLLCEGAGASPTMTHDNTLIAGLAMSAVDNNDSDGDVHRAIVLENDCVATVASNVISGGNGGADGSNQSTGVFVKGINTDVKIYKNWIEGGQGSSFITRGIYIAQSSAIIEGNRIRGNSDNDATDGNDARKSHAIEIADLGATGLNNSIVIQDNTIEGGVAGAAEAIKVANPGTLTVDRNYIYGGVVSNSNNPEKSVGIFVGTDGDASITNNAIHGGSAINGGFAHGVRINSSAANAANFVIRNNTIFSGVPSLSPSKSAMGIVYTQTSGFQPGSLSIDNNIIWAFIDGITPPPGLRICINEEVDISPDFVRNNSLHNNHCPTASYRSRDGIVVNDFGVAQLNAQAFASGNIDTAGFFISRDGPFGQQALNDKDWHLDPNNGSCDIAQGALDGDNSDNDGLDFGYNLDLDNIIRTDDDIGTGWSMGAFEQDSCN